MFHVSLTLKYILRKCTVVKHKRFFCVEYKPISVSLSLSLFLSLCMYECMCINIVLVLSLLTLTVQLKGAIIERDISASQI